ncbi:MAG: PilX N-terminal domain-containing pilus assembly protein [Betaproteobacteria bacterium]
MRGRTNKVHETRNSRNRATQRGVVLITVLIFLMLLTMLGITAMQTNVLQEKEAGNSRDVNVAFQAAEAALRDGENYVLRTVSATSAFDGNCTNGLCTPSSTANPVWADPTLNVWANSSNSLAYSSTIDQVSQQPRYIVELLGALPAMQGQSMAVGVKPSAGGISYRITASGWGANAVTQVLLQSVYVKY